MSSKDYQIIKEIGRGAMGVVYLALDPRLDRQVAIKKISIPEEADDDLRDEFVHRFYREAKAIAKLKHPNVVVVYDLGDEKDINECYMVMEFLQGESLELMLEKKAYLPVNTVLKTAIQACEALNYIHDKQLIHRDIKPGNLFICNDGMIKIMDFGLVRTDDNLDITTPGSFLGSVLYMPIEQIEDVKSVDHRVDIYALGVTIYHALSGEFPFDGESLWDVVKKIKTGNLTPLSKVNSNIPAGLEKIIHKAIARNKEDRFQTMADFEDALLEYNRNKVRTIISPLGYGRISQGSMINPESHIEADKTVIMKTSSEFTNKISQFTDSKNRLQKDSEKAKSKVNFSEGLSEIASDKSLSEATENTLININLTYQAISKEYENSRTELQEAINTYNSSISMKYSMMASDYNNMMENHKKTVELKKKRQERFEKYLKLIEEKIKVYKEINKSVIFRNKSIEFINNEFKSINSISFMDNIFSVFNLSQSQTKSIKSILKEKISKLVEIENLIRENKLKVKLMEDLIRKYPSKTNSASARVISSSSLNQTIDLQLIEDLQKETILEFDSDNMETGFGRCLSITYNNRQVAKATTGNNISVKINFFSDFDKSKLKMEAKIYKLRDRVFRQEYTELEIKSYKEITEQLNRLKEVVRKQIKFIFENLSEIFSKVGISPIEYSPKNKQLALLKINEIKKTVEELKKEFILSKKLSQEHSEDLKKSLDSFVPVMNKFPLLLINFEKENKSIARKRL